MARESPVRPRTPRRATTLARASGRRVPGGTSVGSTSTNAPSRANTRPARASLRPWPTAATIDMESELPARVDGDHSGTELQVIHAIESRLGDHVGERIGRRKLADRLDQIAVGRAVARHH